MTLIQKNWSRRHELREIIFLWKLSSEKCLNKKVNTFVTVSQQNLSELRAKCAHFKTALSPASDGL